MFFFTIKFLSKNYLKEKTLIVKKIINLNKDFSILFGTFNVLEIFDAILIHLWHAVSLIEIIS
jgi:hypothetical protein